MVQSFHLPIRNNTVAATVLTAGKSIFFQCICISVKKDHANVQAFRRVFQKAPGNFTFVYMR